MIPIKAVRITIKALLCVSLIIAVALLLNYVKNLNPVQDGFCVGGFIPQIIHGDDYWTWEKLTAGLYASWSAFAVLFCVDRIIDIFALKRIN